MKSISNISTFGNPVSSTSSTGDIALKFADLNQNSTSNDSNVTPKLAELPQISTPNIVAVSPLPKKPPRTRKAKVSSQKKQTPSFDSVLSQIKNKISAATEPVQRLYQAFVEEELLESPLLTLSAQQILVLSAS